MRLTTFVTLFTAFAIITPAAADVDDAPSPPPANSSLEPSSPAESPPPTAENAAPEQAKPVTRLTVRQGGVVLQVNAEMGLDTGKAFKPVSIAPDLSVGLTDELTIAVEHSSAALTGFRGSAGSGLCIVSKEDGCPSVYRQGGLEALYSVATGDTAVAIDGGLVVKDLRPASTDKLDYIAKIGAKGKFTAGAFSLAAAPSLWIALSNRNVNDANGVSTKLNRDQLWFPVTAWVSPIPELSLGVGSGIKGQLSQFADYYTIPVGGLVQVAVNRHFQLGASFIFGAIAGGDSIKNPDPGADARALQVWLTFAT